MGTAQEAALALEDTVETKGDSRLRGSAFNCCKYKIEEKRSMFVLLDLNSGDLELPGCRYARL